MAPSLYYLSDHYGLGLLRGVVLTVVRVVVFMLVLKLVAGDGRRMVGAVMRVGDRCSVAGCLLLGAR